MNTSSANRAVSLLSEDLPRLTADIIKQVQPLTLEVQNLKEEHLTGYAYELKLKFKEKTGKLITESARWEVGTRVYWWDRDRNSIPHIVFSISYQYQQVPNSQTFLIMGEGTPDRVSWWHPQSQNSHEMFKTILDALRSGKMRPFLIRELIHSLEHTRIMAYKSSSDEIERRKLCNSRKNSQAT